MPTPATRPRRFVHSVHRVLAALVVCTLAGVLSAPVAGAAEVPQVQFYYRPSNPSAGQQVQFTDISTNGPTTWSWIFGDGGTSADKDPIHVFSAAGDYRVKLTASNASGSASGAHTVTVKTLISVSGCDYYAAPAGAGDGLSLSAPFRVADFWSHASPGKTLCLLDGVYDDERGMINPPAGISGVSGSPITVKALYDGGAFITGHASRYPIQLAANDWIVVEGLNACCSSGTVVAINHSNHNLIRRVIGWDSADGNYEIFGIHHGNDNVLEDVAGWGIARKIFQSSQDGNFTTIRRAWGRWEGSHVTGPKMVYTLAYNNYDMLIENSLGTWSGEKMKEHYVLLDYSGLPWTGSGGGTYTNYSVNQPYGIFANDGLEGDKNARARLLGSIAYVAKTDAFKADREVFVTNIDSVEIKDSAAVFAPGGSYSGKRTFGLYGLTTRTSPGGETNVSALNLTSITADSLGNQIGDGWHQENVFQSGDPTGITTSSSIYPGSQGANLCHAYVDGVLTDRPLWPWPMNQRIREALVQSGRAPVDVTKTIQGIFGPMPAECRSADFLLPVVGHIRGFGGETFVTDLHIYNPSSRPAQARLLFQPIGEGGPYRVNLRIDPGQTVDSRDSVQGIFGLEAATGSLVVQTDANGEDRLRINARIFAGRGSGTMGLALTGSPVADSPASSPAFVTGLAATNSFRSNLGAVNTTDQPQVFRIVLRSSNGTVVSETPTIQLGPGLPLQWSIGSLFPEASGMGLLAEFRPEQDSTVPFAFGTLVDNASGDSTFHAAMSPSSTLYLPAIGNITGASGIFLTDLSITNATDAKVSTRATFIDHDGSGGSPMAVTITLAAHQTLRMADALSTLFGVNQSYGALELATLDDAPALVATARVYAPSLTTSGTVGQQINAISSRDLSVGGSLLGLRQDGDFRSNVAFLNPGSSTVTAALDLRNAAGELLASRNLGLPPSRYLQRSLPDLFPGVPLPANVFMTLSFKTSAEPIFAFASVIDDHTGDPSFFPSVP